MSEATLLNHLSHFAVRCRENLPEELLRDARRRTADILGISLAATTMEPARIVGSVAGRWGGSPEASAVGSSERFPAAVAALVNGTLAHALDFDDTHLPSVLHPSAAVVPAALAAAEASGCSGRQALSAVAAGDEVTVRLGMAGYDESLGNSVFFEKGLHATSIAGTIGAAMAAAMAYGLDEERIGHALAISASMGAGLLESNRTGGTVKRIHCGWAAHGGVVAAELAREGLTGPPTVFEGRFGFLQAYLDERSDPEALTRGLGEEWELPRVFFKPYPANHFTHAAIDAALELKREGVEPAQISEIELGVASPTLRTIARPEEEKARPQTGYAAQFSGPFAVATALLGGRGLGVSFEDFTDEAARDPERLALAAKVRCVADRECDRIFPYQFPAILRVRLASGESREVRILHNHGGTENPLSEEELEIKFRLNAERALSTGRAKEVWGALGALDTAGDIGSAMSLLRAG